MHITKQKEYFSIAYVRALAAVTGYGVSLPECDDDSVDYTILGSLLTGKIIPHLDIQLKCTAKTVGTKSSFSIRVKRKNYENLRVPDERLAYPRALVVICVPKTPEKWLKCTDRGLRLYNRAYIKSLRGAPDHPGKGKVSVSFDTVKDVLTDERLAEIMRAIGETGTWP